MSDYTVGQNLRSKHTGARLTILSVSADGNVRVAMAGKESNTTSRYLDWQYEPVPEAVTLW